MILSKGTFIWLAIFALLLVTAASINLSWVQRFHNADSLLVTLISLDRYTPFYWGENRLGQPGPLILSFVHDYRANLFAHTGLIVSASLGCVVLFNLYFLHAFLSSLQRMSVALLSIVLGVCVLSSLSDGPSQMLAVGAQPHTPSLFLMLLALALLFRTPGRAGWPRFTAAFFCLLIAFWLNISIASITLGLAISIDFNFRYPRWKQRVGSLSIVVASLGANIWFAGQYTGPSTFVFSPMSDWLFGLKRLGWRVWPYFFHQGRLLALLTLLLAMLVALRRSQRGLRDYCIPDVVMFSAAAICYVAVIARVEWVGVNGYSPRYWTILAVLFLLLVTGWVSAELIRLFTNALNSERLTVACAGSLLATCVLLMFGLPSNVKARAYLAENINRYDADERSLGCTHFVGDYWIGWTSVFQRESSGGPPIYAITRRSEVTRYLWDWPAGRLRTYCGLQGDPDRERWIQAFGLPPLYETARSGMLARLEAGTMPPGAPITGSTQTRRN